ncbi:MAG: hypothetical protein ACPLRY_05265 [Candidatus Bathyarchaeales archaeon]
MATILIKNVSEDLLKELKRLKVELGCKTWAELLEKLVTSEKTIILTKNKLSEMRSGVHGFLQLKNVVSSKWAGQPTVLEESRRLRSHEPA